MQVLVTGGHGFIGSHVLRQLVAKGHEVACFDVTDPSPIAATVMDEVKLFEGDVTDPVDVYDAVASFAPDRIVHLASLLGRASRESPRNAFTVNVNGTMHVLEAARTLGVDRVVAASSAASYGPVPTDRETFDETVHQEPRSIYGLTKLVVERIGTAYTERYGVEFAALQPVHGLGPDRRRGNIEDAYVIKAAVSDTPITVPRIDHPFEIVSVHDQARAFVATTVADSLSHDVYLVGSGERATLSDIVGYVREHVPSAELTLGSAQSNDELVTRPPSDTTRIWKELGWETELSIQDTVGTYVDWLRENPDAWSFDPADVPWT